MGPKSKLGVRVLLFGNGFERGRISTNLPAFPVSSENHVRHFVGASCVGNPLLVGFTLFSTNMRMTGRLETTTFCERPICFHDGGTKATPTHQVEIKLLDSQFLRDDTPVSRTLWLLVGPAVFALFWHFFFLSFGMELEGY